MPADFLETLEAKTDSAAAAAADHRACVVCADNMCPFVGSNSPANLADWLRAAHCKSFLVLAVAWLAKI